MQIRKWGQAFALRTLKVNFNKRIFITDSRYRYSLKFLCLVLSKIILLYYYYCYYLFIVYYLIIVLLLLNYCFIFIELFTVCNIDLMSTYVVLNHRRRSCEGSRVRTLVKFCWRGSTIVWPLAKCLKHGYETQ